MPVRTIAIPVSAWIPASSRVGPPAYDPPETIATVGTNIDGLRFAFDDTTDETAFVKFTVPDEYVSGTRELIVWWLSDTEIAGDVRWSVQTDPKADNDVWDSAFGAASIVVDTTSGVSGQISKATIDLSGQPVWVAGEVIQVVLVRAATHFTDTLSLDAVMTMSHMLVEVTSIADTISFTAGAALSLGSIVTIDSAGEAVLSGAVTASGIADSDGISQAAFAPAASADIYTMQGLRIPVLFSIAPAVPSNGSIVYLSTTPGSATLTPPVGSGNSIIRIGKLVGADGITSTPNVIFKPQFIAEIP